MIPFFQIVSLILRENNILPYNKQKRRGREIDRIEEENIILSFTSFKSVLSLSLLRENNILPNKKEEYSLRWFT